MSREITLIDYGVGNLFSVARALEHCGAQVSISADPDEVRRASKLLLPGVGAFGNGMQRLSEKGIDLAVKEAVSRGTPLLGVCLGMQLLLDSSDEFGTLADGFNGMFTYETDEGALELLFSHPIRRGAYFVGVTLSRYVVLTALLVLLFVALAVLGATVLGDGGSISQIVRITSAVERSLSEYGWRPVRSS